MEENLAYAQFTLGHADLSKLSKTAFYAAARFLLRWYQNAMTGQ
jgi:hypothetical protein